MSEKKYHFQSLLTDCIMLKLFEFDANDFTLIIFGIGAFVFFHAMSVM